MIVDLRGTQTCSSNSKEDSGGSSRAWGEESTWARSWSGTDFRYRLAGVSFVTENYENGN